MSRDEAVYLLVMSITLNFFLILSVIGKEYYGHWKVQKRHYQQITYFFHQGCLEGTKHDSRNIPKFGFNTNRPGFFCTDKAKQREDQFYRSIDKLFKRD